MKAVCLNLLWISVIAGAAIRAPSAVSYDGFKVFRINTGQHLKAVQDKLSTITFDQWNHDIDHHLDVVISPDQLAAFEKLNLDCHAMHENLGESITAESSQNSVWKRQVEDQSWYDTYHDYDQHVQYFEDLHAAFPDNSELISSGTSYEGRDLYGLHLWGADGPGKPAILYHGTVHAREWISAPVNEYIALQLVTGYNSGDNVTQSFLDSYDFFIIPIVNPDGFVYTQKTERLWRKNRQPGPGNATCYGRDINRNWQYGWDANPLGASTDPCSQVYRGEEPSDTPENQGLDAYMRKIRDEQGIKLYIDWHSYGQYILCPFGAKETLYAPELGKWTKASSMMSEVIRDSSNASTTFTFGPSGATLYTTTGTAPDHVYAYGRAEWSFTIELRDTGNFGFVLPPDQIRGTVEEQWEGQKLLFTLLDEEFFDGEGPAMFTGV